MNRYPTVSNQADMKLSPIGDLVSMELDYESLLSAQLDKVCSFAKQTATDLKEFCSQVEPDMDKLEVAIQNWSLQTGRDPGLSDSRLLSAWEGISYVHSATLDVKQNVNALAQDVQFHSQWILTNTPRLSNTNALTQDVAALQTQMNQVLLLSTLLATKNQMLWDTLWSSGPAPSTQFSTTMSMVTSNQELVELRDRLRRLEQRALAAEIFIAQNPPSPSSGVQFNLLEAKFDLLEARVSSKPAIMCGRTFLSLPDMEAWVTTNLPSGLFWLFHDVVSLLEHVDPATVHRQDIILEQFQSKRVAYDTDTESKTVTLFKITLPQVFYGDKKETTPGTGGRHFPGCKSYANWNFHDG